MNIAIIGGGASGLVASIVASKQGHNIDIYEQNKSLGKRILASGNGRCNISNKNISSDYYFGEDPSFVSYILEHFNHHKLLSFFNDLGLILNIKEDGRIYPLSNEAKSVLMVLEQASRNLGVTFAEQTEIKNIKYEKKYFIINDKKYNKVLIATGSLSAPQLGGNDSGGKIAKYFGHTLVPSYPSLVGLELDGNVFSKMIGVKVISEVKLYVNKQLEQTIKGDVLFTKYGLSGFAILDISQKSAVALLNNSNVVLSLNLLHSFNAEFIQASIVKMAKSRSKNKLIYLLQGIVPFKIAVVLMRELGFEKSMINENLNTKQIKKIVHKLQDWRFSIKDTHGFKHAEVAGGGVSTKDINPKTMESKKKKNLYFAGEVLDIVGARGGYNLHFAWASGYKAGEELKK